MIDTPLISVVVPVFNVENYLQRCIESLLNQTYTNIEILLIDDGSTDGSLLICQQNSSKDKRIKVFSKKNGGLSDARNFGILQAKGKYISFVDSDDFVDRDYIEYMFNLLDRNKADMSICQHRTVFASGKVRVNKYEGAVVIDSRTALKRMLYHDQIDTSAWAKLFPTKFFRNIEFPKGKLFEDIGTIYKTFLVSSKIAVGSNAKYNYIYRTDSIVNNKFSIKKLDLVRMTESMASVVTEQYPELAPACYRRVIYSYISTLNQMKGTINYRNIRQDLVSKIKHSRFKIVKDSCAPLRDKIAVLLISLNYHLYAHFWNVYIRVTKGER